MQLNLKTRIFLTVAFLISLVPMSSIQFGIPGINERTGWTNLLNPIGIASALIFLVTLWAPLDKLKISINKRIARILGFVGLLGIVVAEILNFIFADSPNSYISLEHSLEYATSYFFLGLFVSIAMIVIYLCTLSLVAPTQKIAKKATGKTSNLAAKKK